MSRPHTQLLLYGFGDDARFEGRLVGALERLEAGGALKILDVAFVGRQAGTGELAAIVVRNAGARGFVAPLLAFRLDPAEQRKTTRRALSADANGVPAATLEAIGEELAPGEMIAAVLVEHVWMRALQDAVAATGGTVVADEFVAVAGLPELSSELIAGAATARRRFTSLG